ncbi:unnamed protein product [Agarophyton chilense]
MPTLDNNSPSTIRRRNASERSPENGSTLYSLAESTRLAWERVRRLYATDPNARAYSFADVRRGYNSYDPFTSKRIVGALCCALVVTLIPDAYSKREHLGRLAQDLLRARIADIALACAVLSALDKTGIRGVKLSKNIMDVAGGALKKNVTTLAPLVFPLTEHIKFGVHLLRKKVVGQQLEPYVPDFHIAFQHFCIHTGGRAVIDVMQEALKLSKQDVEASRYVLRRYGNTSSASVWYELKFHEDMGRVRRGDRVWQIAFGSGFKCNSAVWECVQNVDGAAEMICEQALTAVRSE